MRNLILAIGTMFLIWSSHILADVKDGYCGDGIINPGEECDGDAIRHTSCWSIGGGAGEVKCKNCEYDISECIQAAIEWYCIQN